MLRFAVAIHTARKRHLANVKNFHGMGSCPRSHVVLFVNTKHETETELIPWLIRILFIYYCVWFYFSLCSGFNLSLA